MDISTISPTSYLQEDKSYESIKVVIALIVLDTFFVSLFFVSRFMNKTANGWDVYLTLPGYLCCLGNTIIMILMVQYGGVGHHIVTLPPATLVQFLKLTLAEQWLYGFAMTFPKLSLLCFYTRIFSTRPYRYASYAVGAVVILYCMAGIISAMTICQPLPWYWAVERSKDHCGDVAALYIWMSVPNLITDLAMAILPLVGVWRLQTKIAHKIDLTFTFLVGCLGFVAALIRFAIFVRRKDLLTDPTYDAYKSLNWFVVEPGVYLIASTLPSLRPLGRMMLTRVKTKPAYHRLPTSWTWAFVTRKNMPASTSKDPVNQINENTDELGDDSEDRSAGSSRLENSRFQARRDFDEESELDSFCCVGRDVTYERKVANRQTL